LLNDSETEFEAELSSDSLLLMDLLTDSDSEIEFDVELLSEIELEVEID